jgi:hypothetical protein
MASFTALSAWDSLQDRTAANEIVLAYSERRQCVGDSAISALASGANAQDTAFWQGMQDWVKTQVDPTIGNSKWIDHTETITDGDDALPHYTLPAFKTNSGLTGGDDSGTERVVGFRRATTWPTDWTNYEDAAYSYGPIQAGDIRGPWIFEDLQKAFDALRWSHFPWPHNGDEPEGTVWKYKEILTSGIGRDGAIAAIASAWPSEWTNDFYFGYYYAFYELKGPNEDGRWSGYATKNIANNIYISIPNHIPHAADAYFNAVQGGGGSDAFNDCDFAEEGYFLLESFALATTNTRTVDESGSGDVPEYSTISTNDSAQATGSDSELILKWQFSHTL